MSESELIHVQLDRPTDGDRVRFLEAVRASRTLHAPWVTPPATVAAFNEHLKRLACDDHEGYCVRPHGRSEIAGVINFNNIVRGAFCSARTSVTTRWSHSMALGL